MIRVDLCCDVLSPSGYSAHAREVIKALHREVDLKIIDHKHDRMTVEVPSQEMSLYQSLAGKTRDPEVRIQFETPEFFDPKPGVLNIGFTQWETTRIPDTDYRGDVHNNWVKQMNRMDEMWTSCTMAANAFSGCGVEKRVHVVLGPVDTDRFQPGIPEMNLRDLVVVNNDFVPRDKRPFVVGMMAQWTPRKNIDNFLIAMFARFKRGDVRILLKTYGSTMSKIESEAVEARVKQISEWVGNAERPGISLLTDMMTDEQVASFFASCDAYVNTSRGEGFCMPLAQAMSSGVVPISCGFSAPADYVTGVAEYEKLEDKNGFLLRYQLAPAVGMKSPWYRADQDWADFDPQHLMDTVRCCVGMKRDNPEGWGILRANARRTVVERMGHKAAGVRMRTLLEEALARRAAPITA